MAGRLAGEIALVTGAASGIGAAIAKVFAGQGANVIVSDLNEELGQKVVREIESKGGKAVFRVLNVAQEDDWKAFAEWVRKTFGRLDIAVNNAGFAIEADVEHTSLEQWRKIEAVNLDGVYLATRYEIGLMKENRSKGGAIVQMCSSSALVGIPELAAYTATKGAVLALTRAVAVDMAQQGTEIRVNCVCPGYVETPLVTKLCENNPKAYQELVDRHPMGRLATPEEVAYGALYLASPEAKFTTGASLVIDGGYTVR